MCHQGPVGHGVRETLYLASVIGCFRQLVRSGLLASQDSKRQLRMSSVIMVMAAALIGSKSFRKEDLIVSFVLKSGARQLQFCCFVLHQHKRKVGLSMLKTEVRVGMQMW